MGGTLSRDKEAMLSVLSEVVSSEDNAALRPGYLRGL
jgi:hypothetical protein